MNTTIKEWITYILCGILGLWMTLIISQIIPPSGRIGLNYSKDKTNSCNNKIINFEKDMPAINSGLQINDCIISVNGEDVRGKSHRYTSLKIKGKPNTTVNIKVKRNNEELEYNILRKNKIEWFPF